MSQEYSHDPLGVGDLYNNMISVFVPEYARTGAANVEANSPISVSVGSEFFVSGWKDNRPNFSHIVYPEQKGDRMRREDYLNHFGWVYLSLGRVASMEEIAQWRKKQDVQILRVNSTTFLEYFVRVR